MGCVSSKILAKSGSFQEKVSCSLGHHHSFQRSSVIEETILSTTSKSNGDQFLTLLRTSSASSARKAKEPDELAHSPEPDAKIETIHVSELLAGLEEEDSCTAEQARERRQSSSRDGSPAPWSASDGGAAGRARSFRTVEEYDAMVLLTQQQQTQSESGSSSGRATEQEEELATATAEAATTASTAEAAELSGGSVSKARVGAKRRARARQLGELNLNVPAAAAAAFDFSISKSGSLRDWLRQGGQIFSPGSYVTPRFGTSPPVERGGAGAGEQQQQALFDPELVAQFERAMEQLSEDEGRVLDEILEAMELEAAEKDGAAAVVGGVGGEQPPAVLVQQVGGA